MRNLLLNILIFSFILPVSGQDFLSESEEYNQSRTIGVTGFHALSWGGSIAGLQYIWYAGYEKSPFQFFDDSRQWNQMDKVGHFYAAYQIGRFSGDLYNWAGVNQRKSALIGSGFSFAYLTTVEILDGFNSNWGFSWSDVGSNAFGALSYYAQFRSEHDPYVHFKFSSSTSGLAQYRPNVLGNNFASRTLKDYNGQTYWVSFNPFYWFKSESKIPKWIQLSIGYSTQDQLIGDGGTYIYNGGSEQISFSPYRQCFLSLDVDFESIPASSRLLKIVFRGLNMVKIPFPAVEISQGQLTFRPLYF
ncbi:MAG: DUF2279 domain-containing protein [Crocinitomicaceae bacterium]